MQQQLKVEQQNLTNCLEKQPSSRSILEPLLELLCKADRDKVNELEKQLEDQKKIVEISGRELAQLALNMSACQKQRMNLSDSLQTALLNSVEMKQNYEASLRQIEIKVSDCQQDMIKTGEAVKVCQKETSTLKDDLKTSSEQKSTTIEQLKICSQTKQELTDNLQMCVKQKENSVALATNLQENQNTARKEQAKLRSDLDIYQDELMNCMKNILKSTPGAKVDAIINCMSSAFKDKPYPGVTIYTRYAVDRLGLSPLPNVMSLKPELGRVVNDVTSFQYPISIPPCPAVNSIRSIFIAVFSDPKNFQHRTNIRQTWAKDLNVLNRQLTNFAGFAFILGKTEDASTQKQINEENKSNKDIIQLDKVADVYSSSIKIAGFLNWMYKNCANFKGFIFKVADDTYLNVRTVEYFIHSYDPFSPSVFGTKHWHPVPHRTKTYGITLFYKSKRNMAYDSLKYFIYLKALVVIGTLGSIYGHGKNILSKV